jgi:hypothetical protein
MMKEAHLLSGIKTMLKGIIVIFVLLSGILFPRWNEGIAKPLAVTIIHTNNVNGHLFPCPT